MRQNVRLNKLKLKPFHETRMKTTLSWIVFQLTICFFLVVLCFGHNEVRAQAYNFDYLTIRGGLPQSQAFCVAFDRDEYAWIGTQGGGLCRYDGETYNYFTKSDSLLSNRIYCIKVFEDEIWVGQKGGVSVFKDDGVFQMNYRLPNSFSTVNDIIQYKGGVMIASSRGLFKVENRNIVFDSKNPSLKEIDIRNFFQTKEKELWLCTNGGLLSYEDVFDKLTKAKGLSGSIVECAAEFDGEWVIGTYDGGIDFYAGDRIYKRESLAKLDDAIVLNLFVSGDNELWIGTMNKGLFLYNRKDESLRQFSTLNGLSGNHVRTIVADYWDNLWIGTSGGGVSIFRNSPFIKYDKTSGLNGDYVFAAWHDSKDNLWLGTEGMGIMRLNDTSKIQYDEEYGFWTEKVKAIHEDNEGDIWIGTEGKGLGLYTYKDDKDTIYAYYYQNGLRGNWVRTFAHDDEGNIYVGTSDDGIYVTNKIGFPDNLSFKKMKVNQGDLPKSVVYLVFKDDRLWFTSNDGEYGYVENGRSQMFIENGKSFRNLVVQDEIVWLGSKDDGVLKVVFDDDQIQEKNWISTSTNSYLRSNNIYQLLKKDNHLWVGTEKGLDRLELDSSYRIFNAESYSYEEGFEGVETNINAGSMDQNGDLWFGTVDGLFVYKGLDPNPAQRKAPVLRIEDMEIVFTSIENTPYASVFENGSFLKPVILPHDQNHISFTYKAIHYAYSNNIQYRRKLEGFDPDWIIGSRNTMATYSNLPPGAYTFHVQASIDDTWEGSPLTISFEIDRPYWDKLWFKLTYYGFALLLILLVIYFFLRRQRKKNQAQNEKLKLEKNLLELEQKALRLQMNPHFIFNVLNSIHNLIILNESDKARYALSKFSKLMRQVLENSREKFVTIDDEISTLENYVQLERLTANADIDIAFFIDDEVDTAEPVLPPLMLQPFVENAIVHGFKGMDETGKIEISFKWLEGDVLECCITDNGIGRVKAIQAKAQRENYHKSTALKVAEERLANLNGNADFVPFEFIDLKDDKDQPIGTKVIFRILIGANERL